MPTVETLPTTLPVFPLQNVILMPGAALPLNVFEPRYLNMVEDALRTHHLIGMMQPNPALTGEPPPLYTTGCAGRITSYAETADGRILISLTGIIRFGIREEIETIRGYRQVVPEWSAYTADLDQDQSAEFEERERLDRALRLYLDDYKMDVEWDALERMPDMQLINLMATLLPIEGVEKQAILEAPDESQRAMALLSALEFGLHEESNPSRH